jgi:hypothetical protein
MTPTQKRGRRIERRCDEAGRESTVWYLLLAVVGIIRRGVERRTNDAE